MIVKPKLITQEKAAFKYISVLNRIRVYDMSPPLFYLPLSLPCIEYISTPLPFTSGSARPRWDNWIESLKQIELSVQRAELRCCMPDIKPGSTHHSLCQKRKGGVKRKRGKRPLRGAFALLIRARLGGLVPLLCLAFQPCFFKVLYVEHTLLTNRWAGAWTALCYLSLWCMCRVWG